MSTNDSTTTGRESGRLLLVVTLGWILLFSYLLLTSDPPDIGPIRLRSFEDSGHFFGSLITGFLLFRLMRCRLDRPWLAAGLSLAATLAFLGALELIQEIRPGRGYQRLDIQLNLAGSFVGVALGWTIQSTRARMRNRQAEGISESKTEPV